MFVGEQLAHAQKEYVGNYIEILHQSEADFIKKLQRQASKEPTNYRGRREPLEVAPNPSLSAGNPAGGDLASPSAPDFNHLLINYVWLNTGLETSYEAQMNFGKGTVGSPETQIMESTAKTFIKWLNIYASNGNGTTRIGIVSARTSDSVLTLDASDDSIGATQVLVGQKVKVYDPTGTTQRVGVVGTGSIKIGSKTNTTLTRSAADGGIDWPSTVQAGDIIVPEGATPSVGMKGIPYITNDVGDYFGLSRSNVDVIRSVINPQGGAALTASALIKTHARLRQRVGNLGLRGTGITELAVGISQWEGYYNLIPASSFQHIGSALPKGDVGLSSFDWTWFSMPIECYLDWQGSRVDFLNFDYLKIANLKEIGSMAGMPINEELQSFNGTTGLYRAAKSKYWDVARDYFSPAPHRLAAITELGITNLSKQKTT